MRKTSDGLRILDRMTGPNKRLRQRIEEATLNARVAEMIYEARTKAGLSQQTLADLVGTKQPVIARLEDANYQGHSLSMLARIAAALHRELDVRLLTPKRKTAA